MQIFYIGVKGVIKTEKGILLLKKNDPDGRPHWDFPGGRMDEGETIEQALRRELAEEMPAMTEYAVGELLNAHAIDKTFDDGRGLMLLMYKITAPEFEVQLSEEHFEYKWINAANIAEIEEEGNINPGYLAALKK